MSWVEGIPSAASVCPGKIGSAIMRLISTVSRIAESVRWGVVPSLWCSSSLCSRLSGRDLSESSGRASILDFRFWILDFEMGSGDVSTLSPGASLLIGGVCGLCGSLFIAASAYRLLPVIVTKKALEAKPGWFLGFTQFRPDTLPSAQLLWPLADWRESM